MTNQSLETSAADAASFVPRHIGPSPADVSAMLELLGYDTLDALIDATVPAGIRMKNPLAIHAGGTETDGTVPAGIRMKNPLAIHAGMTEHEALNNLRNIARKNQICRSYIGLGYHDTVTPPVIQRNVLENPGWY